MRAWQASKLASRSCCRLLRPYLQHPICSISCLKHVLSYTSTICEVVTPTTVSLMNKMFVLWTHQLTSTLYSLTLVLTLVLSLVARGDTQSLPCMSCASGSREARMWCCRSWSRCCEPIRVLNAPSTSTTTTVRTTLSTTTLAAPRPTTAIPRPVANPARPNNMRPTMTPSLGPNTRPSGTAFGSNMRPPVSPFGPNMRPPVSPFGSNSRPPTSQFGPNSRPGGPTRPQTPSRWPQDPDHFVFRPDDDFDDSK